MQSVSSLQEDWDAHIEGTRDRMVTRGVAYDPSEIYLEVARIRYELSQLTGDLYDSNETVLDLLKREMKAYAEPAIRGYCLTEIGKLYGSR